ncbi:flagellar FlbD family protein [Natranaerobius trueperi]|uniref:Flagellar protein FlbD n=1 Tax=Natranaerobius trueperi TaxID=759412 RepID=A0A226C0V7_9FIRM|nr:flagellar FlbD family protein [Natranaerobius trueperi]OWZ84234.1 flagellar protein FlbD [Natranaerobius trueperi]
MIKVTRLNGKVYTINSDLIEFIEETPDTVISLVTGRKVLVKESSDQVVNLVVDYRRRVGCHPSTVILKEGEKANDGKK